MKKVILATLISGAMSASALAANAGSGTVTFSGSIVEAACSIAPESVDQTVELGSVAASQLATNGRSASKPFQIQLENCDMDFEVNGTKISTVTAAFTGGVSAGDTTNTQLAIVGSAGGAAVVITGADGTPVKLDGSEATAPVAIQDGNSTLQYAAYLQGNGTVVAGDFTALANYTLSYQ